MNFNAFLWRLYRESPRGHAAIQRFSSLGDDFVDADLRTIEFTFSDEFKEQYPVETAMVNIAELVRSVTAELPIHTQDEAVELLSRLQENGIPFEMDDRTGHKDIVYLFGEDESEWYDYVASVSLGLHQAHPGLYLPYNFRRRFQHIEEIHREFGIPLPPVPGKLQKEKRGSYYSDINSAWQEFRSIHSLSPPEMCAFLYDFAPQFTTAIDSGDLPNPSKAWMITGGSWDIEYAENATTDSVAPWGANSAVRRGDILVMYLVRPLSSIHSIWRACTDGFVDPFSHYHSIAWICNPSKTVPVSLNELKQHPLLSRKSAVRANFQGPHGKVSLSIEEFDALLSMMGSRGQDLRILPRIPTGPGIQEVDLLNERDVEIHLIEPFLHRLGYCRKNWIRQMPVKMGRGERNYPDYAIGAVARKGEESARMILELKYQLTARREFTDAFFQTKSYALRLQSQAMAMGSREGVWVFIPRNGNFDIDRYIFRSWNDLCHPDHFHEILCAIGRDRILGRPASPKNAGP